MAKNKNGVYDTNHIRQATDPARFAFENKIPIAKQYVAIEILYTSKNIQITIASDCVKIATPSYIGICVKKRLKYEQQNNEFKT